jgi:hypothetical protein
MIKAVHFPQVDADSTAFAGVLQTRVCQLQHATEGGLWPATEYRGGSG